MPSRRQPTPRLDSLFANKRDVHQAILKEDPNGFVRGQAERLLERAATLPIRGIEKLAADAGDPTKFGNLLAELRFAIRLAELGAEVRLLRDQEFGRDCYTPDLEVTFPDGLRVLVEVTRFSDGSPDIVPRLHEAIVATAVPFRVTYRLGKRLSTPVLTGTERDATKRLVAAVVDAVALGLREARDLGMTDGLVHILHSNVHVRHELGASRPEWLTLPHLVRVTPGDEWLGSFGFERSTLGRGYLSGGHTEFRWVDLTSHGKKLVRDLAFKAKKRPKLPTTELATPFIVAIENDEPDLETTEVLSSLTGSRCDWGRVPQPVQHFPEPIEAARRSGWERLLSEWDYSPHSQLRLTDFGVYAEGSERWSADLSAVLVAHHAGRLLQWLPNPCAAPSIREPQLLDIGLPLDKLGADVERVSRRRGVSTLRLPPA